MSDKTNIFIEKCNKIHNYKYDYSKVEYKNCSEKICIICKEHSEFWQTPKDHLSGRGCPICGRLNSIKNRTKTKEQFIKDAINIHGNRYDYSKTDYKNCDEKVCIICKEHGEFMLTPTHHLSGEGCRLCGINQRSIKNRKDKIHFINRAKIIHNDNYDYSNLVYNGINEELEIVCKTHGIFKQLALNHLHGEGCPICGQQSSIKNRTKTLEEFIGKANIVHKNKYDYSKSIYNGSDIKLIITCPIHGDFEQQPGNHLQGQGCKKCFKDKSNVEYEILEFIKMKYEGLIIENDRKILDGKEIDILLPEIGLGIEVNGLIWHSEFYNPDKNYHLNKTKLASDKKIRLIHIFEDEWKYKNNIVKSLLSSILNDNEKIYARKCEVKEITHNESKLFLDQNHLQGNVNASIRTGLLYNNELVCVMTFGKNRINLGKSFLDGEYEMLRFCNKLGVNVIGGASKLLSYFIKTYNPIKIRSYADRRWSKGNMYEKLGFEFIRCSPPNYYYVVNKHRENRFNYRKDILVKGGFDKNKTEHEIMIERGIPRVYDCGCLVYEKIY